MDPCAICCDPLCTEEIGFTIPCGHGFHRKCFGAWNKSRRSALETNGNDVDCKCPICNQHVVNFIDVFLNFPEYMGDDDNHEDSSDGSELDENDWNSLDLKFCLCDQPMKRNVSTIDANAKEIIDLEDETTNNDDGEDADTYEEYISNFNYISELQSSSSSIPMTSLKQSASINLVSTSQPDQANVNSREESNVCQSCYKIIDPSYRESRKERKLNEKRCSNPKDTKDDCTQVKYKLKNTKSRLKITEKINFDHLRKIFQLERKIRTDERLLSQKKNLVEEMKTTELFQKRALEDITKKYVTAERKLKVVDQKLIEANAINQNLKNSSLVEVKYLNKKCTRLSADLEKANSQIKKLQLIKSTNQTASLKEIKNDNKMSKRKREAQLVKDLNLFSKAQLNIKPKSNDFDIVPQRKQSNSNKAKDFVLSILPSKKARKMNISRKKTCNTNSSINLSFGNIKPK